MLSPVVAEKKQQYMYIYIHTNLIGQLNSIHLNNCHRHVGDEIVFISDGIDLLIYCFF